MNSDGKPDFVRSAKKHKRVLIRRCLIAALLLICMTSAYSFFFVFRFHKDVATLLKQDATLYVNYIDRDGKQVSLVDYDKVPPHRFIPGPLIRYQRSLAFIALDRPTDSGPTEVDEVFQVLTHFPKLEELHLEGMLIDQNRATAIASLPNLKGLKLQRCQIEKSCLTSLLRMTGLTHISLENSEFQEAELEILSEGAAKETLVGLGLSNCNITDRSATLISRCRNLELLRLDGTQITDMGLKQLARLPQLRVLILDHTDVTDAGVSYLSFTPNLVELSLSNTEISDETLDTLKRDIPALRVSDD